MVQIVLEKTSSLPGLADATPDSTVLIVGGGDVNYFLMFTPKIGEDEPILTHMFQLV